MANVKPIKNGEQYGRLTIVEESKRNGNIRMVLCNCKCGNKNVLLRLPNIMRRQGTKSCGCIAKEVTRARSIKHGLDKNPLCKVHREMLRRCYNNKHKFYEYYGGRGITVCKRWRDKENYKGLRRFVKWAEANGYAKGLEIDRRKNNSRYSPENCRWVTPKVNANNRRKRSCWRKVR